MLIECLNAHSHARRALFDGNLGISQQRLGLRQIGGDESRRPAADAAAVIK